VNWLAEEKDENGVPAFAMMDIASRALRLTPTGIYVTGCGGGSEILDTEDESQPVGRRLSGLQGFVNLGAYFLAWAKDNHSLLPAGKSAEDVKSLGDVVSDGSRRCYLVFETEADICIRWFGWPFSCDGTTLFTPRKEEITAQGWCDRAQYVLDFYATHGVTPTEVQQ
jgi:hypothetical protein